MEYYSFRGNEFLGNIQEKYDASKWRKDWDEAY
jgi:hypothetical protein